MLLWLAQGEGQKLTWSLSNIGDNNGIGIAVTGMAVVFVALSFISLAIALLPRLLEAVEDIFPSPEAPAAPAPSPRAGAAGPDEAALAAAIGLALIRASEKS